MSGCAIRLRMFALRAVRQTGHHASQRRAYAAIDAINEGSRAAPVVTPPWSRRFELEDEDEQVAVGPARRTVCIRMPKALAGGMVDAFAIIRAIERKFGRIREYRFLRVCAVEWFSKYSLLKRHQDGEVSSEYQMLCWAAFHSVDSMSLVPEKGITMNVPAATQDATIPEGGPGLKDLQGLLDPKDVDSSSPSTFSTEDPSKQPRLIEINVQRAGVYTLTLSHLATLLCAHNVDSK